jgi:hypothetical protein
MQSLRIARPFPSRFVKTVAPRVRRPYSTPSAEHNYEHIQLSTPRPGVALSTPTLLSPTTLQTQLTQHSNPQQTQSP